MATQLSTRLPTNSLKWKGHQRKSLNPGSGITGYQSNLVHVNMQIMSIYMDVSRINHGDLIGIPVLEVGLPVMYNMTGV